MVVCQGLSSSRGVRGSAARRRKVGELVFSLGVLVGYILSDRA